MFSILVNFFKLLRLLTISKCLDLLINKKLNEIVSMILKKAL